MRLTSVTVKNFRALEDIHIDFEHQVNVVVGPNAIGKTTLLEAIRLAKCVLAPRTQNEPTQALLALGAILPQSPTNLIFAAIARDLSRPIEIRCQYQISDEERTTIAQALPQLATDFALARLGQTLGNPLSAVALLSSPQGRAVLADGETNLRQLLNQIESGRQACRLDLTIDPRSGRVDGGDNLSPFFIAFLDRREAPSLAKFSYFPADRALPAGEQPVQLGVADAFNQLESYMSQPHLKYTRLKNTIFAAVVATENGRAEIQREFDKIFNGILKGKKFISVGISDRGSLSIQVGDTDTSRVFDIDGMSSGEKGLILTFLLIARSMARGGIILIDEPELHLNPAVCTVVLEFLIDTYVVPKDLQVIACSHSPEILAGAFGNDKCALFHLRSENLISKVHYRDQDEITGALSRLGTSESEGLLYKATIFVEGQEDIDLLQEGFGDLLRRYKLKDLGGRREVEKQIHQLQRAEQQGLELSARYFIFDRDEAPTALTDSRTVKILQWGRRCLENYMLDPDVLAHLLRDSDISREPVSSEGEVRKLVREVAISQIDEFAVREVYKQYNFEDTGLRADEIRGKDLLGIANALAERLIRVKEHLADTDQATWKSDFLARCGMARRTLESIWDTQWMTLCDGKRVFADLAKRIPFKMACSKFKKRVMLQMRSNRSAEWSQIYGLLSKLIGTP